MFNDKQLQYFLCVYEERNITMAAKKLFISQPALSRVIRDLERTVGTELFLRDKEGVQPTQAGTVYYECCRQLLNMHQDALRKIQDLRDSNSGYIRLGLSSLSGEFLLPKFLKGFQAEFPGVELRLTEAHVNQLNSLLLQGTIDMALTYDTQEPELEYEKILEDQIYVDAPESFYTHQPDWHYGFSNPPLSPSLLNGKPMILLKPNRGMRSIADRLIDSYQLKPKIILETDSMVLAHKLVLNNEGFTLIPKLISRGFSDSAQGVYYELEQYPMCRTLYLATRRHTYHTKAQEALARWIRKAAEE